MFASTILYFDSGTISMLIAGLAAAVSGGVWYVRNFFYKVKGFLSRRRDDG